MAQTDNTVVREIAQLVRLNRKIYQYSWIQLVLILYNIYQNVPIKTRNPTMTTVKAVVGRQLQNEFPSAATAELA